MKAIDLRKKSIDDLGKELVELRKAQFNSVCKLALNNLARMIS